MNNEQIRLQELESFHVLDTGSDQNLDELASIASLACGVPMSQITFVHKDFTYVKANISRSNNETTPGLVNRTDSFCQYALEKSEQILAVSDATEDIRFQNNPYVISNPKIRFYAGRPLSTETGNVLGTLCILDTKPQQLTEEQRDVLDLLAKRVMKYLESRRDIIEKSKKIENDAEKLKKLTDNLTIGIFQLKQTPDKFFQFEFLNDVLKELYPHVVINQPFESFEDAFLILHEEDRNRFIEHFENALTEIAPLNIEYRVKIKADYSHHLLIGKTERLKDESIVIYGSIRSIDNRIEYQQTLEQIAFDISHILRRPVTNLLGFKHLIEQEKDISMEQLLEYVGYINVVSEEMEAFTRELNEVYHQKRLSIPNFDKGLIK